MAWVKNDLWKFLTGGLIVFGVMTQVSDPTQQEIAVTFPGGAVKIDSSKPEIAHDKMLEEIFADEFAKGGLMDWLAGKDIFSFEDERLVEAIAGRLCASIPEQPLDQRIKAARACAEQPVARRLRQLAEQKRVPFHYVGSVVEVGFPPESQPGSGFAHVCMERELRDRRVELTNPRTLDRIEVQASGWYRCTSFSTVPDIQLNFSDARKLFPGPLDKFEKAVAVPLN